MIFSVAKLWKICQMAVVIRVTFLLQNAQGLCYEGKLFFLDFLRMFIYWKFVTLCPKQGIIIVITKIL